MTAPSDPGGLQFDKVSSGTAPSGMTCANCGKPITDTYYTVRDKPICEECKQKADAGIAAHFAKGRSSDAFGKAVLYGIGARLDQQPDLIFRLHNVDEKELIAGAGTAFPQGKKAPAPGKVLGGEDLSVLFGLELAQGTGADGGLAGMTTVEQRRVKSKTGNKRVPAVRGKGKVRIPGSAGKPRQRAAPAQKSRGSNKK